MDAFLNISLLNGFQKENAMQSVEAKLTTISVGILAYLTFLF